MQIDLPTPLTLHPRQSRLIDATAGLRLEVHGGCLWLTRPHDSVDRFLQAGASIELHEDQVLIQSEPLPGSAGCEAASYRLLPLRAARSVAGATGATGMTGRAGAALRRPAPAAIRR